MKTTKPYKSIYQFLMAGTVAATMFSLSPVRAEDDDDEDEKSSSVSGAAKTDIIEGSVIKVKAKNNEIYVRTGDGKRKEIFLSDTVQITEGTTVLKVSDLKKDMKVKVTGRNKVEVLK